MENETNSQIQTLLSELAKDSYLVLSEAKALVRLFESYSDTVIPLLIEKLKDQSDNHYIKGNALIVLAFDRLSLHFANPTIY